jgi:hypothetical protein
MSIPDFSSIFPLPKVNFPCNFNPNPGFIPDCIGIDNPNATVSTSSKPTGPMIANIGSKVIAIFPSNIRCEYDPSKQPLPLVCSDKYCKYYYTTNLINTPGFDPPNSHTPSKIVCSITNNTCTYDPTISQQLICDNLQCRYHYNDPTLLANLTFNPPYSHSPDEINCNQYTPADYQPPFVPNFTRETPKTPAPTAESEPEPEPLPSILQSFTLYNWALPITIPSTLTTEKTMNGNPPDQSVKNYWIQPPYVPSPTYSDVHPDPNPANRGKPFHWTGFKQALSKCIELDGSTYAPSSNICGTPSATNKCIDPLLVYPNKKPKCYAVSTQSDSTGIRRSFNSLNYNLVEEPNSSPSTSLSDFNTNVFTSNGNKWVERNRIDKNYLFCQPLFYTWIKNTPSGAAYNTNTCTPVVCPRGRIVCPSPSSSTSSRSSTNICVPCSPVTCPVGSTPPNFSIRNCPGPIYPRDIPYVPPDNSHLFRIPPSFYEVPTVKLAPKYVPPARASTPTAVYIIAGVVIVIVLVFLYFTYGPGAENDVVLPLNNTIASKISKKLGGYFYYD